LTAHTLASTAARGLAAVAVALSLGGCVQWGAWTPDQSVDPAAVAPSQAVQLELGQPRAGELVCAEGFCQQWYRLDVPRTGVLRVEAQVSATDVPAARIVLHDGVGNVLARAHNRDGGALVIERPVKAGVAPILVQCGKGRLPYTLVARLEE